MQPNSPQPPSSADHLKLGRRQQISDPTRRARRREKRLRQAQGFGIALFFLAILIGALLLIGKGCSANYSPASSPLSSG